MIENSGTKDYEEKTQNKGGVISEPLFYDIIYTDPAWEYRHCASNSRKIENHYNTMKLEDIKKLEVPSKDNSICFMWTTSPKLQEALEVMSAWGFDYRSSLIWDKKDMGLGYWFRIQHEFLLVGVKGKMSPPPQNMRIRSILSEKLREHSRKPDIIRSLISKWYPNHSKIEMFSRNKFEGWDTWGNQVPKDQQQILQVIGE